MITIKGEHYDNDYCRKNYTINFTNLEDVFAYMKTISNNFSDKFECWFPHRNQFDSKDYDWCKRISCNDETSPYHAFWIYQIENDEGIIYSSGKYTDGQKFCSKKTEEWLNNCTEYLKNKRHKFVED